MVTQEFLHAVIRLVGEDNCLATPALCAPYLQEQRGRFESHAHVVILPATTEEVAALVKLCAEHKIQIVPQGGNTGLVGGAVATTNKEILINLQKMNRVIALDAADYTMTVEAGCTLQQVKNVAVAQQRCFPMGLSVAAKCQIGGVLSTNAGGINVLRYGMARDMVLGIEAVLPNGEIVNTLQSTRKNNIGFDVKQLFIGAEGAFGIITKATLKLFPLPQQKQTFVLACTSIEQVLEAFMVTKNALGEILSAFELLSKPAIQLVAKHRKELQEQYFPLSYPWLVLAELESSKAFPVADLAATLCEDLLKQKIVADILVPSNKEDAEKLWKIRAEIPWVQREEGASIKHDIALPLSQWAGFMAAAEEKILQKNARVRIVAFGHLGDGNIHYNLMQPIGVQASDFLEKMPIYNEMVHDLVHQHGGTFSAEHGIGLAKRAEVLKYVAPEVISLQQKLKMLIDPTDILNPHKGVS
jgi:FAD/FMN-containing dehydrogenase